MTTSIPRRLGLASTLLLTACGTEGGPDAAMFATDSAGITIVTNTPELAALPEYRLSPDPEIDLGTIDGPPELRFFRVMDGLVLDDGGLALLNAGSQELRFYDAEGRYLSAQGRQGDGPGEYVFPYRLLRLPADSLLIYDIGLARFTVIDPSGGAARTFTPARNFLNEPQLAGLIGDSVLVIHETLFAIPTMGFDTMYSRAAFIDLDGAGSDSLMVPDRRMGPIGSPDRRAAGAPFFEPRTSLAVDAEGLWVGLGRAPEVLRYDATGLLMRRVRWNSAPIPVTEADVARELETLVEGSGEREGELRRMWGDVPAADHFPFYDQLEVDREGRLWVREYGSDASAPSRSWLVFDPEGRLVARATLPTSLTILEIGEDSVLGVEPDELDVEHVRLWTWTVSDPSR